VGTDFDLVYRPSSNPEFGGYVTIRRPPPPGWVTWVGRMGKALIACGLLLLAFVGYQLWGTGIQEARHQRALRGEFEALLAAQSSTPPTAVTTTPQTATSGGAAPGSSALTTATTTAPLVRLDRKLERGDPIARIDIPEINMTRIVVSGVAKGDLTKGPGHYPDTPLPGEIGNAAIAGHRTTFGAPFFRIDELAPGDEINVTTLTGRFVYRVNAPPKVVTPNDFSVLEPTPDATLTLTSCNPRYSARQRIVVTATLDLEASAEPAVPPPTTTTPVASVPDQAVSATALPRGTEATEATGPTDPAEGTEPALATTIDDGFDQDPATIDGGEAADQLSAGWFSEPGAWGPTILYALSCVAVLAAGWWLTRRIHPVTAWMAAALPFVVMLYFFFENVSRLLPPNF
jgi:sortase A